MLTRSDLLQFSQSVEVDFHIKRFDTVLAQNYIQHRLAIAGRENLLSLPMLVPESHRPAMVSRGTLISFAILHWLMVFLPSLSL